MAMKYQKGTPSEPIPWTAAAAGTSRPLFNTSRRETVFIFPHNKPREREMPAPF
jgi:hypothetical protein